MHKNPRFIIAGAELASESAFGNATILNCGADSDSDSLVHASIF
jgi:hypothetical protein